MDLEWTPLKITLLYAFLGGLWIGFSDAVVNMFFNDPQTISTVQTTKGAVYIVATALLIYALTTTSHNSLQRSKARVEERKRQVQVLNRVLRHNLRNELNVIMGHAELLGEEEGQADSLETINNTAKKLAETSDKLREYEQIIAYDQESRRPIDIAEIVQEQTGRIQEQHPEATVITDHPESATALSYTKIGSAIKNLLQNPAEHGTQPTIHVTVEETDQEVTLTVRDDGPGIPQEEIEAVRRGAEDPLKHGSGLGLWIADLIAQKSGGELTFPETQKGATVKLKLPKPPRKQSIPTASPEKLLSTG